VERDSHPIAGKRILLLEDNFIIALDVRYMLEDHGALVDVATNVPDAFAMLSDHRPDIAILDVNVGGGKSFAIAERLLELEVPFLFATGYDERATTPAVLAAAPIVKKPFNESRLLGALARFKS
jgi:DNA-binding response OmpR family regulator